MKNLAILSLFISLVVLVMTLSVYFYYITPLYEFNYPVSGFVTEDTAGFDINTTAITFGSVIIGGTSTRSILVNNSFSFPVRVETETEGEISNLILYEPTIIGPNQVSKFYLTFSANSSILIGNYTGNITLKLMRT